MLWRIFCGAVVIVGAVAFFVSEQRWSLADDEPKAQAAKEEAGKDVPEPESKINEPKKQEPKKVEPNRRPAEPAKPPAGPNPLQQLLQRLIVPPGGGRPVPVNPQIGPPNQNTKPVDPDARDHIDARAPKDRRQAEQLRKATAAIDAKDWHLAIDLLQNILTQEEDSVDRFGKEGYGSVRERAMRLMLKLPAEALQTFGQRFGKDAQRLLDEAEASGRTERLALVAARFLVTESGQEAADRLGTRHLDRGEAARATFWFRLLADMSAPVTQQRLWQLKAAMTAKLAGDTVLSDRLLKGDGSHGSDETLQLAEQTVRVQDWMASFEKRFSAPNILNDWPMLFGTSKRSGILSGGEPLLLKRWSQPLTQVQPLQRQIEVMFEDCVDHNRATVMVVQPLLINGLVVLRTLAGVQVFDLEKGRRLWTSAERWPAEELIGSNSGQYVTRQVIRGGVVMQNMQFAASYDFTAQGLDQNPLAHLFFSHGNFGQLSSDGRQLFAIEDDTFAAQNVGYWGQGDLSRQDPLRRSWVSNKLVSYDLRSGRPLWAVGGVDSEEVFQPELPGVFFFGAPVRDGDDLLIIGERDAEVRLFCLQAATGKPIWSQLLATAELGISRDFFRRQFAAQVAISDGVIVCPTTVGWLVGVDRASHQILWLHRYSNPLANNQRRNQNQAMTVQTGWGQRWSPSAPMISGDTVVYTPQEFSDEMSNRSGNLVCLKLQTGERRWNPKPKETWISVNGVADGKVLLVGQNSFGAFTLADGNAPWAVPVNTSDGVPSGLGVVSGDRWHVPLTSGQLWTISLKNGAVLSKQWGPPDTRLGNLSLYRGAFLSVHPAGVVCFEQRESIAQQVRQLLEANPNDPLALLTEASIAQLERRPDLALAALRKIPGDAVSAELTVRYQAALRDALTIVSEAQPHEHSAELKQLEQLIDSPDTRLRWQRLKVAELRGLGQISEAFDLLIEMSRGDVASRITLAGPPERSVRVSTWLAGQFAELWSSQPEDKRPAIEGKIVEHMQRLSDKSADSRRLAIELFGFHSACRNLKWQEIDELIAQKELSHAELALIEFANSDNSADAARARLGLVNLNLSVGLKEDAAAAARQLTQLADTPLPDNTNAAKWVEQQIAEGKFAAASTSSMPDWSHLAFRIERSFGYHNYSEQSFECVVPDARWPYFLTERFQYQQVNSPVSGQRLVATGLDDNQLDWSLPLRQKGNIATTNGVMIRTIGHQMLVFHRDVLHMLSPVDRRVVWTRSIESRTAVQVDPNQALRRQTQPVMSGGEFVSRSMDASDESGRSGLIVLCSPQVVVYRGRRMLTGIDAKNGEWLWTVNEIPTDARLAATHDLIHVTSSKLNSGLLLRVRDGQEIPLDDELRTGFANAKMSLGADLLLASRINEPKPEITVERWNPVRRSTAWKTSFANNDFFQWIDQQSLLSISAPTTAEMKLQLLDIETGKLRLMGTLKNADFAGANQQKFAIADRDRLFMILSGNRSNYYGDEFVSIPVNGSIVAFDRNAGGEVWRDKVANQSLVVQQFASSPLLLMTTRRFEQKGRFSQQIASVLLLDKKTGRKMFEDSFPNQYGGYRSLTLNLSERQIELQTYNERIRLIGDDPKAASSE